MAEKQNKFPPRIDPNARARKLVSTAADISNTFEYRSDLGATISCRMPSSDPSAKMSGRSISRA